MVFHVKLEVLCMMCDEDYKKEENRQGCSEKCKPESRIKKLISFSNSLCLKTSKNFIFAFELLHIDAKPYSGPLWSLLGPKGGRRGVV